MSAGSATSSGSFDVRAFRAKLEPKLLGNLADAGAEHAKASLDYPGPQAPSNPGEAPNSQTGELYEGISAHTDPAAHASWVQSVRPDSNGDPNLIPHILEEGGTHIAPRPYMSPAYEHVRHSFDAILEETLKEI